ncbi:MAG: DUF11 domain-containing protein, partial [Anaerolineales bacterium]|nr:DUF11 domain-containing protein [Anaerolineales bacterium]
ISYSDIQGSGGSSSWDSSLGTNGGGNIDSDPLFVDPDGADDTAGTTDDNLRLSLPSPAIDAGNNYSVTVTTDLDGNPRFVDISSITDTGNGTAPIVDMGAYERQFVDVALTKAVSPTSVEPGGTITFTLTFSNSGSIAATNVVLTDTIPTFLHGITVDVSGVVITVTGHNPSYVWEVSDIAPGQRGTITLTGVLTTPLAAGIYTNTAFISVDEDVSEANNTASVNFTVINVPPAFTSTPVLSATAETLYTYSIAAEDHNGDSLTITATTLPAWLTLTDHGDGTASLSGTPTNADVGDHDVALRVTDSGGLFDTQTFTISVASKQYLIYLPLVIKSMP